MDTDNEHSRSEDGSRIGIVAILPWAVGCIVLLCVLALRSQQIDSPDEAVAAPFPIDGRIVSLAPNVTETLFALGLGSQLCATTDFCHYPPEAQELPRVGGYIRPAYERIVALQPDLIFALPEHLKGKDELERLGLRVAVVDNKTVPDILQTITDVGRTCHAEAAATGLRDRLTETLGEIRQRTAKRGRPRVLLAIGRTAGQRAIGDVYVAGTGSFHDELLRLAGGQNVVDAPNYPMVSAEGIIRMNPDIIIDVIAEKLSPERARQYTQQWHVLDTVAAVAHKRLHLLAGNHTLVPGPRFILTVQQLERILHPALSQ